MPVGWEIAPADPQILAEVIAKHHWGIQVLALSNGFSYNTMMHVGHTPGAQHSQRRVAAQNNQYVVNAAGQGLLIRTGELPAWSAESYRAELLLGFGKKRKFTDCTICCKGEELPCHRSVLAHASPVFEGMLDADMIEGKSQCININDAEPDVIKAMVEFAYTGLLEVKAEHVAPLLIQADVYQMDALMRACAGACP